MKVLIADDIHATRSLLESKAKKWGYEVTVCDNGIDALKHLLAPQGPRLAVLDWEMPGLNGVDVCRKVRSGKKDYYIYIVLLTAKDKKSDTVKGLDAGADDYITKPFDDEELHSRLRAGERIISLESTLAKKIHELQEALNHVQQLQGLLPICMHCGKVRDHQQIWHKLEAYVEQHSGAIFSHGLCEECLEKIYPPD